MTRTPPSDRTAFINARLLDPDTGLDQMGGLLVEGAVIADLGPRLFNDGWPEQATLVDCQGHCLCPGLIDMHAWTGEPGAEHRETLATAARAAAAGGVTTLVVMPNTDPPIDDVALVEFVLRRARETAVVHVLPAAAATKGLRGSEMTEIGLLAEAGAVAFTDGDRAIHDARVLRRALSYASAFDLLLLQICEEPSLAQDADMNESETATRLGLAGVPSAAETVIVRRDLELVALTKGRWHAAHLSTGGAIGAVRQAKAEGVPVSAGAAPANFALNEGAVGEYRTFAKVKPPLRAEADRLAVVEAIADGTIDVISSAHCPQDPESKRLPFAQAAFGAIGLETMLALTLELYHNGSVPLLKALACLTVNPARLLKLEAGRLAKNRPADLLLFDLHAPWRVDAKKFRSKSKNSPFDERPLQGHALRTVVGGQTVFQRRRET
jgi:dihydroorotase